MKTKNSENYIKWQKSFERETKTDLNKASSETDEGIEIKPVYTKADIENLSFVAVSYTHLTLPTIYSV